MWHISLPGLKNVIAITLILQIGSILSTNTELILLLYLPATYETADVIGTYIYRLGIEGGQFIITTSRLFMVLVSADVLAMDWQQAIHQAPLRRHCIAIINIVKEGETLRSFNRSVSDENK